jgi:hypothetical protein
MADRQEGHNPALPLKNLFFYFILLVLGYLFFATVRDNTFWHYTDYLYLQQALKIDHNWREIFAQAPLKIFQPVVNLVFYAEFRCFGLDAKAYYVFNVFIHVLNSFLVYFVVSTLLKDRTIAVLSSLLFLFAVGNYGKAVMVASGISDLLITLLTLSTLLLYFKNELDNRGKLNSIYFYGCLICFFLSLLSKATSFSILGCILAFNFFFRVETKRGAWGRGFIVLTAFALIVLIVKYSLLPEIPGQSDLDVFSFSFVRNYASYLVRMVFPIQTSHLVTDAGPVVRFVYNLATEIRILIFLCIVSYSVFGFIFGNRTIRFFIAWTYITVAPFCFFKFPADWLNIRYLYLVSIGFCMILASGTVIATRLLYQKAWRRFLPYLVPFYFILLSQLIITLLDRNYQQLANSSHLDSIKTPFMTEYNKLHSGEDGD